MFNTTSLADRLKAAVNTLEQTGTSLQNRALAQNNHAHQQPQSPSQSSASPQVGGSPTKPAAIPVPNERKYSFTTGASADDGPSSSPTKDKQRPQLHGGSSTSPSRSTSYSQASHLAENALAGLRKGFAFGRNSLDGPRPTASSSAASSTAGTPALDNPQQELKDMPSPRPEAGGSRPGSPARFLNAQQFSLGSDPSSSTATPRARTPVPGHSNLANAPLSPPIDNLPPPDPSDPATYPLPPSPGLTPVPLELQVPSPSVFADPLGASPRLNPEDAGPNPILTVPTPDIEQAETELGITPSQLGLTDQVEEAKGEKSPELEGAPEERLAGSTSRYEDLSRQLDESKRQIAAANKVLKELTPLEGGIEDVEALEGWVRMMNAKVEMITAEMQRLQAQITLQESRIEEIRDTHRLEGTSQTDLIAKLRQQLSTAETNLAQKATELLTLGQLRADLAKAQTSAKEEEEKRTKAISLLKTVRAKLVKVEKEKEEIEKDRAEERAERSRAGEETERVKAEREREVNALRKGFERELAGAKERYEKELQTRKATWELEMITTKAGHAKEISNKSAKVNGLEAIVKELNATKQQQFEDLQSRQAEVETARAEMMTLQSRTKELEFQLREVSERCAMLEDQAATAASRTSTPGRGRALLANGPTHASPSPSPAGRDPATSAAEVQRLLADAEQKAEAKVSELRGRIRLLERERNEVEEEWAAKVGERVREVEKLRRVVLEKENEHADTLRVVKEREAAIEAKEAQRKEVERSLLAMETQIQDAKADVAVAAEAEKAARDEVAGLQVQISTLNSQLDDAKNLATQLRQTNKTLREEMRKVQSSVQLMERQRNPGVGYWAAGNPSSGSAGASAAASRSALTSPTPDGSATPEQLRRSLESVAERGSTTSATTERKEEEEVNLEYLRNVILQFLEHKEMRPNLVRVLSVILRFTPQELRRLNAKLLT